MTLVEKLVRHYSPSGYEQAAVVPFLKTLESWGFRTQEDEVGNAIGTIGQGPVQIYLVGHIDTVPGEIPVKVEKNILSGRGSVDAKGCLAAFAEAARLFVDSEEVTITVVGCVAEETDSKGAYHLLNMMPAPDYVIIGEPSGWEGLTLGYRGALRLDYVYEASRHHHGSPEPTPAEAAVQFHHDLSALFPDKGSHFNKPDLRIAELNTYSRNGRVGANMRLDLRTPPGFDFSAFQDECLQIQNGGTMTFRQPISAVLTDKRNALVRSFLGVIRDEGGKPVFKRKTGTADMNILAEWGCPILTYGPGDSTLDHTDQEQLNLDEYEKSIQILKTVLEKLGKQK